MSRGLDSVKKKGLEEERMSSFEKAIPVWVSPLQKMDFFLNAIKELDEREKGVILNIDGVKTMKEIYIEQSKIEGFSFEEVKQLLVKLKKEGYLTF